MEKLKDFTECSICMEQFTDPRILPCIHTFCLKCLEGSGKTKRPGEMMPCPLCREEFIITQGGFKGLKKNFFLNQMVEIMEISSPASKQKLCDACVEDTREGGTPDLVPPAVSFCVECHQNLCQECSKHHGRNKLTKSHKVMAFGAKVDPTEIATHFTSSNCDQHPNKPLEMFCSGCETVICMMCFAESHQNHQCSDVKKVAEQFRSLFGEDVNKVSNLTKETKELLEMMSNRKLNFLAEIKNCEMEIRKRSDDLKKLIEDHTVALLDELTQTKENKLRFFEEERLKMEKRMNLLEEHKTYFCRVMKNASPCDVCRTTGNLLKRTDKFVHDHKLQIQKGLPKFSISFEEVDLQCYTPSSKISNAYATQIKYPVNRLDSFQQPKDPRNIVGKLRGSFDFESSAMPAYRQQQSFMFGQLGGLNFG